MLLPETPHDSETAAHQRLLAVQHIDVSQTLAASWFVAQLPVYLAGTWFVFREPFITKISPIGEAPERFR